MAGAVSFISFTNCSLKAKYLCTGIGLFLGLLAPAMLRSSPLAPGDLSRPEAALELAQYDSDLNRRALCEVEGATLGPCSIVKIDGFRKLPKLNGIYTKDPTKIVQGRAVYMNHNMAFFAYWCERFQEWRWSIPEYVDSVQQGGCRGWAMAKAITLNQADRWVEMIGKKPLRAHISLSCIGDEAKTSSAEGHLAEVRAHKTLPAMLAALMTVAAIHKSRQPQWPKWHLHLTNSLRSSSPREEMSSPY